MIQHETAYPSVRAKEAVVDLQLLTVNTYLEILLSFIASIRCKDFQGKGFHYQSRFGRVHASAKCQET